MVASSPGLPRLSSRPQTGRPGRFWYIRLRQVDTNVASCQLNVKLPKRLSPYSTDSRLAWAYSLAGIDVASFRCTRTVFSLAEVTFVSTWHNLTYQNLPGLPTFTSEAATKSLGRPGDKDYIMVRTLLLCTYPVIMWFQYRCLPSLRWRASNFALNNS